MTEPVSQEAYEGPITPEGLSLIPIVRLDEEQQAIQLNKIVNQLAQGYATQNYVRELKVHPEDVEFIASWLQGINMPQIVRQLCEIVPNDGSHAEPGVILQNQIETEWLSKYYKSSGLIDYITAKEAPLVLTHKELKLLFLLEGMLECDRKRRKILLPGE